MSVLIRGMEMPTRCGECSIVQKTKSAYRCPLASKAKGFSCVTNFGSIEIPEYCPLVEIPAHGRLIDADAMIYDIRKQNPPTEYIRNRNSNMIYYLQRQKTVIKAEDGE